MVLLQFATEASLPALKALVEAKDLLPQQALGALGFCAEVLSRILVNLNDPSVQKFSRLKVAALRKRLTRRPDLAEAVLKHAGFSQAGEYLEWGPESPQVLSAALAVLALAARLQETAQTAAGLRDLGQSLDAKVDAAEIICLTFGCRMLEPRAQGSIGGENLSSGYSGSGAAASGPQSAGKNPLRWIAALLALCLARETGKVFVSSAAVLRSRRKTVECQAGDGQSLIFLAVKEAVYTALFGAPDPSPGDGAGLNQLSDAVVNSTLSNAQAVESFAGQLVNSTITKAQELVLNPVENESDILEEDQPSSPVLEQADVASWEPRDALQPNKEDALDFTELVEEDESSALQAEAVEARVPLFGEADGPGAAQPGDFFLFIKDYSWTLRYRISTEAGSDLDTQRPLLLEWVKLRKPVSDPVDLIKVPSSDLFEWDVVEPPRHDGFMYQVTEVVGSGVEAVINFFKGKALKLLVQQDGISLVSKEPGSEVLSPRPVTHCWVQVMGLPFLPILQYIAFFDSDEVVTDWRA